MRSVVTDPDLATGIYVVFICSNHTQMSDAGVRSPYKNQLSHEKVPVVQFKRCFMPYIKVQLKSFNSVIDPRSDQ